MALKSRAIRLGKLETVSSFKEFECVLSGNLDARYTQIALDLRLVDSVDGQPLNEVAKHQTPDRVTNSRIQVQSITSKMNTFSSNRPKFCRNSKILHEKLDSLVFPVGFYDMTHSSQVRDAFDERNQQP